MAPKIRREFSAPIQIVDGSWNLLTAVHKLNALNTKLAVIAIYYFKLKTNATKCFLFISQEAGDIVPVSAVVRRVIIEIGHLKLLKKKSRTTAWKTSWTSLRALKSLLSTPSLTLRPAPDSLSRAEPLSNFSTSIYLTQFSATLPTNSSKAQARCEQRRPRDRDGPAGGAP